MCETRIEKAALSVRGVESAAWNKESGIIELEYDTKKANLEKIQKAFDASQAAGDKAVVHCRKGKGPYILELMTYRYRGHSMSDPAKYRSKDEVQKMRAEHDPIEQVRVRLIETKAAQEPELKEIDIDKSGNPIAIEMLNVIPRIPLENFSNVDVSIPIEVHGIR